MATRKSSKKPAARKSARKTSDRGAAGRASIAKGRKFEDGVAELYRLQGAEVTQNIEIADKKIDILATATAKPAAERGMNAVRRLDVIARNVYRDDPATLAAWESARHVTSPTRTRRHRA